MSGVLRDKRINSKVKGKYTKTVGKPPIMYGAETCAVKKVGYGGNEDVDMDVWRHKAANTNDLNKYRVNERPINCRELCYIDTDMSRREIFLL